MPFSARVVLSSASSWPSMPLPLTTTYTVFWSAEMAGAAPIAGLIMAASPAAAARADPAAGAVGADARDAADQRRPDWSPVVT